MYSICHIFSTYLYSQHQLIRIRDNLNLKPKSCCTIHSNKDKMVCTHAPLLRWWGCDGTPAQFLQYVWKGGPPPVQGWVEMLHHWEKQWEKSLQCWKRCRFISAGVGGHPLTKQCPQQTSSPACSMDGEIDSTTWFTGMQFGQPAGTHLKKKIHK